MFSDLSRYDGDRQAELRQILWCQK